MCHFMHTADRLASASRRSRRARDASAERKPPERQRWALSGALAALALCSTTLAQTISPSSIVGNPSATCGGGTDSHSVCVTLPATTTANRVDVFLLLDDTGSFTSVGPQIASVFNSLVSTLQSSYPGVDFAFGVGRFEDYGGNGSTYSFDVPTARPFILNQGIVKPNATTLPLLVTALGRTTPGGGGDSPESAIEALYQVATGVGFDGNCDGDVIDSGPAGAVTTQTSPGSSGDVPAFSSYAGVTDGSLGGVGWRECSVRLVILATDVAPVSPFKFPSIPASVTGYGSTEPSSAFAFGWGSSTLRYGLEDNTCGIGGTVVGAVAPLGAATVPATVSALNNLGIQVIGVGPGAVPTASTTPNVSPSESMSALARITGAVDATGKEMVYDSLSGTMQAQLQSAIGTAINRPMDITLAPVGLPSGLTASWTPPTHAGVTAGSTVCFNLNLTGGSSFAGGSFILEARDLASNACLGDIPVTLSCETCELITNAVHCNTSDNGWDGTWTWTFSVTNHFGSTPISSIDFGSSAISPSLLPISPAIAPGQTRTLSVSITSGAPWSPLCVAPRLLFGDVELCAFEQCVDLPSCDCWEPLDVRYGTEGSWWNPNWFVKLNGVNLNSFPVRYALIAVTSPSGMTVSPQFFVFNPAVAPGAFFSLPMLSIDPSFLVSISDQVCVTVSLHDESMRKCCSQSWCVPITEFFGDIGDGDFNDDTVVDAIDLSTLLAFWGMGWPAADLDSDGLVGAADLSLLLSAWGPVQPGP